MDNEPTICWECGKPAASTYNPAVLIFQEQAGEFEYVRTDYSPRGLCPEHRQAYVRSLEQRRLDDLRDAYKDYVEWCHKCDYTPSSFDSFKRQKRG
jgi:hypothetical protein